MRSILSDNKHQQRSHKVAGITIFVKADTGAREWSRNVVVRFVWGRCELVAQVRLVDCTKHDRETVKGHVLIVIPGWSLVWLTADFVTSSCAVCKERDEMGHGKLAVLP